ncbi:Clavaminate synthase-like protein, partial [Cryphonectria parasitica EP155]
QFHSPLALLDTAVRYNLDLPASVPGQSGVDRHPLRKLYIAQAPLDSLPKALQEDVPTPRLVQEVGRGDLYGSSIWLGLEPTYTPLHRDPNPNLFVQLCGSKIVRLLPPDDGEQVYATVQARLGRSSGNSRIRGVEMMAGEERALLYDDVWEVRRAGEIQKRVMLQADLAPGDALFIPQGWWHSVKSTLTDGRLNGSVNWWFR